MTINKMGKHKHHFGYEKTRNKTLNNLCGVFTDLMVGVDCPTKEGKIIVRQNIIKQIQKGIGCNKRTAYDYIQAVETIMESLPQASREAIIGGKKEHTISWEDD